MLCEVIPFDLCDLMSLPIVGQILFLFEMKDLLTVVKQFQFKLKSDSNKYFIWSCTYISAGVSSVNGFNYYQNEKWLHPVHFLLEVVRFTIQIWLLFGGGVGVGHLVI